MSQTPSTFKVIGLVLLATLLGGLLFAQDNESPSPSDAAPPEQVEETPEEGSETEPEAKAAAVTTPAEETAASEVAPAPVGTATKASSEPAQAVDYALLQVLFLLLTIFVLAVFLGIELIAKVPPTLHTPLMSGANAISGITLVGAVIVAASVSFSGFVGFIAVTLATVNAVGGFMVTHRMLAMFKKR